MTSATSTQEKTQDLQPGDCQRVNDYPQLPECERVVDSLPAVAWLALDWAMPEFYTHSSSEMTGVSYLKPVGLRVVSYTAVHFSMVKFI